MFEIINNLTQIVVTAFVVLSINALALFGITYTEPISPNTSYIKTSYEKVQSSELDKNIKGIAVNDVSLLKKNNDADVPTTDIPATESQETLLSAQNDPLENITQVIKKALNTTIPETVSNKLNTKARNALINILCTTKSSGPLNPISGSGIIINPKGIIITNAHIAQYFLLKDYPVKDSIDCFVRTGSPAAPAYNAELLYISANWIQENAKSIRLQSPEGTGESDFALLRITSSKNTVPLPPVFPYIIPDTTENLTTLAAPVLLAGYPAEFLSGQAIQKNLWQVTTITNLVELFTFASSEIDLFSLGSNLAAQKGSSGGGIIHIPEEKLIGIVVTSTDAKTTDGRILNAITLAHINRQLYKETNFTIADLLASDVTQQATVFQKTIAPTLKQFLVTELDK